MSTQTEIYIKVRFALQKGACLAPSKREGRVCFSSNQFLVETGVLLPRQDWRFEKLARLPATKLTMRLTGAAAVVSLPALGLLAGVCPNELTGTLPAAVR